MLRNEFNSMNDDEKILDELQKNEEEKFKQALLELENEIVEKASQIEEKNALIDRYTSLIAQLESDVSVLTEELVELNEQAKKSIFKSGKILKAQEFIAKLVSQVKEKCKPKKPINEQDVQDVKEDMLQSNLTDEKKKKAERVLNAMIKILSNK